MIGGIDIQLPTWAGDEAVQVSCAIREHWPQAVFESGDSGDKYEDFRRSLSAR